MGLRVRVRKLEERVYNGPEPSCPECGGVIRTVEVYSDGSHGWISGGSCSRCDGDLFADPEALKAWAETPAPLHDREATRARANPISLLVYVLGDPHEGS